MRRSPLDERQSYRYLIYSLFMLSGVSGLIYQIVWTRELVLVFGNTMLATATVLSAFMGGLAAGSYVLGRYIDSHPRPLIRVYAVLEAGIGVFGLLFPVMIMAATPIYAGLYGVVEGNIVLLNLVRFAVCFGIIAIPTFFMGGTLPVLIKRFASGENSLGHQTGFLYGLNTVGAVIGTVACGYILLRILGMQMTTWVAVAINLGVAVAAWFLGRRAGEKPRAAVVEKVSSPVTPQVQPMYSKATVRMVLIGIGLSGFCALAYEVFWTRMLNLFLHNNIYSFTAILATFLVGIAVGSLVYGKFLSRSVNQIRLFIWLEIGIGAISFATPFIFRMLHSSLFNNFNEALTLAKTSVIMIGPTIMMGIAVPLAIQICQRGANREGTSVGTVYAVNTIGAILGAFMAGFILLPTIGLHMGVILVASLNIIAGFLPLLSTARARLRPVWGAALAVIIAAMVVPAPSNLFRGLFQDAHPNADIVHYKEGKVANVLVYDFKKLGYKDFHLNAVNEASSRIWHVQLFKMLGLLPTLVHDNPTDALMIAFGAGMSAGATARNVESLDCVDLNPDIAGIAAAYTRENLDVINQPNFHQIVNDGRNALLLNERKYSLIISDATNPKMFDSWTLYSQEFYQLVKERLKPGGVFCQWAVMPLPGEAIKVILNTFRSVFPHMSFWSIHGSSQVLMLGTPERLEIDYNDLAKRLEPLYDDAGLAEFGIDTPEKFLSFFLLGEDGVSRMLTDFDLISTDDLPHAQFYINQDSTGTDNCLDLVRYQESIVPYMKKDSPVPETFVPTMTAYEDIARRLNIGWLIGDLTRFAEAAVVADDAGLDDANVAHHLNYCPEKMRHFQARLVTHPEDVTARNWVGSIHLKRHEYEQAEREFKKVIELKPDHTFARMNLAMTYLETGRIDSAVSALMEVRKLSPTRNILNVVNQQLGKARILRKMAYQPDSPELARSLGIAYYNEGRILDAVRSYRRAAELSNNDPSVLYNLARICERHEYVAEAALVYEKLSAQQLDQEAMTANSRLFAGLNQDPAQLRTWLNERLVVPEPRQDTEEHPPSCDEALAIWNELDPDGAVDTTNLRRAAELYEQSTVVSPDDLHAYADAAVLFEELHDFEHAAELWNGAVQIRPDLTFIPQHINRLRAMAQLERTDAGSPEKAALLVDVARDFRAVNEPERAVAYLRQSLALDSSREAVWLALAETSAEAGMYAEAIAAADRALSIRPGLEEAETVKATLKDMVR